MSNSEFLERKLHHGDCLEVLRTMPDCSVDAVVTDPPYGLAFMGKRWDYDVPSVEIWTECLRVLKPGGHLLAFAGTRTQHRMAVRIEDAGFEIRDMIAWVYGSGFPKSHDVGKAIDKRGGNPELTTEIGKRIKDARERRGMSAAECDRLFCGGTTNWSWFEGRPTGQRAPTPETFAAIAEQWPELEPLRAAVAEAEREVVATVEASRLAVAPGQGNDRSGRELSITTAATESAQQWTGWGTALKPALEPITVARKPLASTVAENVLEHGTGAINIDGCRVAHVEECRMMAPSQANIDNPSDKCRQAGRREAVLELKPKGRWPANLIHDGSDEVVELFPGAARFFYTAKASRSDRDSDNRHPTVKPTDLMRYLCRLVTPPCGIVLDPFMGSGSTGKAAMLEGFDFIGIERDADSFATAQRRIGRAAAAGHQPSLL